MIYYCCDERRRSEVLQSGLNGIDFLEVLDNDAPAESQRQRVLFVHFLKDLTSGEITRQKVLIEGGERIRGISVTSVSIGTGAEANVLTINLDRYGDFSTYTLRLVKDIFHALGNSGGGEPPAGFDLLLSSIPFSFKVECPSDFDCRPARICPPEPRVEPEIDYLAKDYNSFRQLMLDRMSVLMPQWQERNAADVGVTLVELLAYVGDHLSYQQDAIATEAYLDTARRRISVRRHALLVDYSMHDGCNARTWVQVQVDDNENDVRLKRNDNGTMVQLLTRVPGVPSVIDPAKAAFREAFAAGPEVFETMHDALLFGAHNKINFYTWTERDCCLPKGSTRATLLDPLASSAQRLRLRAGDVLILEERVGSHTGLEADANPTHRQAVRLTKVNPEANESQAPDGTITRTPPGPIIDSLTGEAYVEVEWSSDDALSFALCLSSTTDEEHEHQYVPDVGIAYGNIVLADHGLTINESLGSPLGADEDLATVAPPAADCCTEAESNAVLPRFRPQLTEQPLTQAAPLKTYGPSPAPAGNSRNPNTSAAAAFIWEMRDVLPAAKLADTSGGFWLPRRDLLSSDPFAEEFVAEVDENGQATLRFGDDQYGLRPAAGIEFAATYRIGNGARGNLGGESLTHIITTDSRITAVRNPLPARGGIDPESIEHVRRVAPSAFRIQERAVTPEDYVEVAERHRAVQRAAATMRWTGSWYTVFLSIDRLGGGPVDAEFEREIRLHLERYRMAGHDLEINGPQFVSLEIVMTVCVKPDYYRGDVEGALLRVFNNTTAADGQRGIFHPDNFSFGQSVYLSALYAAAQQVEGVRFVTIDKLQRLNFESSKALDDGFLGLGSLEIARLDNDPNFAERGVFRLNMEGGK